MIYNVFVEYDHEGTVFKGSHSTIENAIKHCDWLSSFTDSRIYYTEVEIDSAYDHFGEQQSPETTVYDWR